MEQARNLMLSCYALELIIDEHEQNLSTGTLKNNRDIVEEMILLSRNASSDNHQELDKLIDRPSIKLIMIDIITAAIDTSFTSIEWILVELMRNPSAMKNCQEELTCILGLRQNSRGDGSIYSAREMLGPGYRNCVQNELARVMCKSCLPLT